MQSMLILHSRSTRSRHNGKCAVSLTFICFVLVVFAIAYTLRNALCYLRGGAARGCTKHCRHLTSASEHVFEPLVRQELDARARHRA